MIFFTNQMLDHLRIIQKESHDNSKIQTTKWLSKNGSFFFVVKFKLEKNLFRILISYN